jgi:hypothetical protein
MSKRRLRKRRHVVEAHRAELRAAVRKVADSALREIDAKMMAVSRMAADALDGGGCYARPLGLLRGQIPAGQSFKLDPGEFIGMLDCNGVHRTLDELDEAAGPEDWQ